MVLVELQSGPDRRLDDVFHQVDVAHHPLVLVRLHPDVALEHGVQAEQERVQAGKRKSGSNGEEKLNIGFYEVLKWVKSCYDKILKIIVSL